VGRVVLVTGVARDLGARLASTLCDDPAIDKVVGIDVFPPQHDLGRVKFVRADIRTPVVGKVLAVEDIDTVVHMNVAAPERGLAGRGAAKELNVIGTMQLLAACQAAPAVDKLVLQSSTAVYGSSPRDPAMFTESMAARGGVRSGFPKDAVEVEGYVRGLGRRRPDIVLSILRVGDVLSPYISSPFGQYFSLPVLPSVLGYDPRLQFVHEEDVLNVLRRATTTDRPGVFNVTGPEVVTLSQAARRLAKPLLRLPSVGFTSAATRLVRTVGASYTVELTRLLTYGRVVDTTALGDDFGYEMRHTTGRTLDEFVELASPGALSALGVHHG